MHCIRLVFLLGTGAAITAFIFGSLNGPDASPATSLRQQQREQLDLPFYHHRRLLPESFLSLSRRIRGSQHHLLPCSERCNLSRLSTLTTFLLGYCVYRAVFSIKALAACEWVCRSGHCSHGMHVDHLPPSRRASSGALGKAGLVSTTNIFPLQASHVNAMFNGVVDASLTLALRALGLMAAVGARLAAVQRVMNGIGRGKRLQDI